MINKKTIIKQSLEEFDRLRDIFAEIRERNEYPAKLPIAGHCIELSSLTVHTMTDQLTDNIRILTDWMEEPKTGTKN